MMSVDSSADNDNVFVLFVLYLVSVCAKTNCHARDVLVRNW